MDARFFPLRDGSSEPFYLRESAPLFRKAAEKSQVPPRTHSHSRILIQGFGGKGSGHEMPGDCRPPSGPCSFECTDRVCSHEPCRCLLSQLL